jgi:S1-C subfamily serine protease
MIVNLIIILIVIYSVVRNWGAGLISQVFAVVGLFVGIFIGRILESYTITLAHNPSSRAVVTLITIFGVGFIGLSLGEFIGISLKYRIHFKSLNLIDNYLGSFLTIATILVLVWLAASVINDLPATKLQGYVKNSQIIIALDKVMPPAPGIIAKLGKVIDPNGFPDVFIGNEPIPNSNVKIPALGSLIGAVNKDRQSVVRIQGDGCGGIVSGSGFVVANDLVVTNAHVVAGIKHPYIDDVNGVHVAQVIWFNPNLDLAVLKTSNLAGQPLRLDLNTISPNTGGAVLGYPGGGPFSAVPAAVIQEFEASGHNIYGNGVTLRQVYSIDATVIPGNSGGPLINNNGLVIGVVFAESTSYAHTGYALAMPKVASQINQAEKKSKTVSTGQCAD